MPEPVPVLYWDADVFLSYIEDHPVRAPVVQSLLADARSGTVEIVTSALTIAEVAYASAERLAGVLSPDLEQKIDALWEQGGPARVVEVYPLIAARARNLIRLGIPQGWSLKPADAIHLATAQQLQVTEIHVYDGQWARYADEIGIPISEPHTDQERLL
jgi:predicted nucleic acid-binding protein